MFQVEAGAKQFNGVREVRGTSEGLGFTPSVAIWEQTHLITPARSQSRGGSPGPLGRPEPTGISPRVHREAPVGGKEQLSSRSGGQSPHLEEINHTNQSHGQLTHGSSGEVEPHGTPTLLAGS